MDVLASTGDINPRLGQLPNSWISQETIMTPFSKMPGTQGAEGVQLEENGTHFRNIQALSRRSSQTPKVSQYGEHKATMLSTHYYPDVTF